MLCELMIRTQGTLANEFWKAFTGEGRCEWTLRRAGIARGTAGRL